MTTEEYLKNEEVRLENWNMGLKRHFDNIQEIWANKCTEPQIQKRLTEAEQVVQRRLGEVMKDLDQFDKDDLVMQSASSIWREIEWSGGPTYMLSPFFGLRVTPSIRILLIKKKEYEEMLHNLRLLKQGVVGEWKKADHVPGFL